MKHFHICFVACTLACLLSTNWTSHQNRENNAGKLRHTWKLKKEDFKKNPLLLLLKFTKVFKAVMKPFWLHSPCFIRFQTEMESKINPFQMLSHL